MIELRVKENYLPSGYLVQLKKRGTGVELESPLLKLNESLMHMTQSSVKCGSLTCS